MSDIATRLERGERWQHDNEEVLKELGFERIQQLRDPGTRRYSADAYYIRAFDDRHVCNCRPLDNIGDAFLLIHKDWLISLEHLSADEWQALIQPDGVSNMFMFSDGARGPNAQTALCAVLLKTAREVASAAHIRANPPDFSAITKP